MSVVVVSVVAVDVVGVDVCVCVCAVVGVVRYIVVHGVVLLVFRVLLLLHMCAFVVSVLLLLDVVPVLS